MWDCFVYYQYYADTMQHRAMELTSRKLEAALQLEGSFSENGLAALSTDSSAQTALCKSLSERIDSDDIQRKWPKINAKIRPKTVVDPTDDAEEVVTPEPEPEEAADEEQYGDTDTMPPGVFVMLNSKGVEYMCRVRRSQTMPQPYIEATPLGVTPALPPLTITVAEVRRDGWKLDVGRINDDTLIELHRDGFDFTESGTPEGVREVGTKRKVVGGVPFETGVPEPGIKSPLDRHTMEKQMVAETIISYGFDSWFDEPEKTDESDSLFEDFDTGALDDLFAEPAPPAAKPQPKKTKRAAAADVFDDWFDEEPVKADEEDWPF